MPENALYVLKWSSMCHSYELHNAATDEQQTFDKDTEPWLHWLTGHVSFAFEGRSGHLTLLKETRKRGNGYWYAYKRQGKRTLKKYIGRTSSVTFDSLEEVARLFNTEDRSSSSGSRLSFQHENDFLKPKRNTVASGTAPLFLPHQRQPILPSFPLLTSKVRIPQLRSRQVGRPHLLIRLQQQQEEGGLILLSAPAGSGKTSVLTEWLTPETSDRGQSKPLVRAAWLSLEEADNDPIRFLTYVLAALQTLEPEPGHSTRSCLQFLHPSSLPSALVHLLNDLMGFSNDPFILVLDDFHLITSLVIHQALSYLLAHLPGRMCLAIATRTELPFSVARLRAQGKLLELFLPDLSFTHHEIEQFLQKTLALTQVDLAMVNVIEHHTEGWIAGIQLIGLALRHRQPTLALPHFYTRNRSLLEYLLQEVLMHQPMLVQRFVLYTCLFDRLCNAFCVFVLGAEASLAPLPPAPANASPLESRPSMLEWLEQANLFLVALDEGRQWYRYHALFANVLRSHLQQTAPQHMLLLYQKASHWHEQEGMFVEAIQYALQAADFERAALLIEQTRERMERQGHFQMVWSWLQMLPDNVMQTRPLLCLHHALFLLFSGEPEASHARLRSAEACLPSYAQQDQEHMYQLQGALFMVHAYMAHFAGQLAESIRLARQALQWILPDDIQYWRLVDIVEAEYRITGETTTTTVQSLETAIKAASQAGILTTVFSHAIKLAQVHMLRGHWRQAEQTCEYIKKLAQEQPGSFEFFGNLTVTYAWCMSSLAYQRNDLSTAQRLLAESLAALTEKALPISPSLFIDACMLLALTQQVSGQRVMADATLELAEQRSTSSSHVRAPAIAALRARLALLRNDLSFARQWAEERELPHFATLEYTHEQEALTLARVFILQGEKTELVHETLCLLKQLLHNAEHKERFASALEILLLLAIALDRLGDRRQAVRHLERAIALAAPEGIVRLFVDEGLPLARLLSLVSPGKGSERVFLRCLMAAFPPTIQKVLSHGGEQVLSAREREILHLLSLGMTNAKIAQTLIISQHTVKRHISTLFLKLEVMNRTQAVARARDLGLLI